MKPDRFMMGIAVCAIVPALWGCKDSKEIVPKEIVPKEIVPKAEKIAAVETETASVDTVTESEMEAASQTTDIGYMFYVDGSSMEDVRQLLSQKYGITIEKPSDNSEEGQVGLKDGNEVFRFFETDREEIIYSGDKIDDVTIFGTYPGMNVDSAWTALTGYGFYSNPKGEIENCLLADFDSGSVSVYFWTDDDKVTLISVALYDKTVN